MKYRTIGKAGDNEMQVSAVSFGCWELGGDSFVKESDETNIDVMLEALALGITTFDTAEGYGGGHSERLVGEVLKGRRSEVVIASKVAGWNLGADHVMRAAEASLRRLQTDYLDIYYVHCSNPDYPIAATLASFNRLKEEGLIRAIGLSNFSLAEMKEASRYAQIDVIQPEYSLLERSIENGIVSFCLDHGIGIMSYSPVAKGVLTGAFHAPGSRPPQDFRAKLRLFQPDHLAASAELIQAMREAAASKGATITQIAVSWMLHRSGVSSAIVGTQNIRHLRDNAAAADIVLSGEEVRRLDEISLRAIAKIDG